MSKPLKPRRGTTEEHAAFIGLAHEVTYDTDKHTLVTHDGVTPGGFPLAREAEVGTIREDTLAAAQQATASGGGGETGSVTLEGVAAEVARLGGEVANLDSGKADIDAGNFSAAGKSLLATLGMPSANWYTITSSPVSGATYTAPANGWVRAAGMGKSSGPTAVDLKVDSLIARAIAPAVASPVSVCLPAKKGDLITLTFSTQTAGLHFIYAVSEEA